VLIAGEQGSEQRRRDGPGVTSEVELGSVDEVGNEADAAVTDDPGDR
jgi:hypothetical protein